MLRETYGYDTCFSKLVSYKFSQTNGTPKKKNMGMDQYLSIPINTIFRGMNIHLPAILMFTRGARF